MDEQTTAADYCTACGAHFSDPHGPTCPQGDDADSLWVAEDAIRMMIADTASGHGADVYTARQWGDPDADADVLTTTRSHGLVVVSYDDMAGALRPSLLVKVYVYPMPRPLGRNESIVDYAREAMLDADGANRQPEEIEQASLGAAVSDALFVLRR